MAARIIITILGMRKRGLMFKTIMGTATITKIIVRVIVIVLYILINFFGDIFICYVTSLLQYGQLSISVLGCNPHIQPQSIGRVRLHTAHLQKRKSKPKLMNATAIRVMIIIFTMIKRLKIEKRAIATAASKSAKIADCLYIFANFFGVIYSPLFYLVATIGAISNIFNKGQWLRA